MYCICGKAKEGYAAAKALDGGEFDFNYDYWVCGNCRLPTRDWFAAVSQYVPHRAVALLSVEGQRDGTTLLRWATATSGERITTITYKPYPRKVDMETPGRDHLVSFWHALDTCIDNIRGGKGPHGEIQFYIGVDAELEKVRAHTYANVLAELMHPFYADSKAILAESMERWKARQTGETRESPGLAEGIWDPNTRFDGTPWSRENEARARSGGAIVATPVALDEQKANFVKHALETGSMTADALASMFGVSVEVIKATVDA